jgi:hypothetical protein
VKLPRRIVLRGLGGVTLGLPLLESLAPRGAFAQTATEPAFAIFFRQANGVNQASGTEPERFWPTTRGVLTDATMQGRAVDELAAFKDKLLIVRNVNMQTFNYGDGHATGALQGLTARGPTVQGSGGDAEAAGESIDHRIGRELNPGGLDSLFLHTGATNGWLGGPCISYRSSGQRRSALVNPVTAYQNVVNASGGAVPSGLARGEQSVNDLVREQLQAVLGNPRLSKSDKDRLDLHLSSVRDLETELSCQLSENAAMELEGLAANYSSTDGDRVLSAARAHMMVAALAVACGYTTSVAIQVGNGHDGYTRYRRLDNGALMENYHYVSHRRSSHDSSGALIPDADLLHHMIDRQFARTFRFLLERLAGIPTSDGKTLLEKGVCAWYNDNSNGPPHAVRSVPWVLAGSCGGYFKQGQYLDVTPGSTAPNHNRLLNTILTAVGVRKADGSPVDDFGDPSFTRGLLSELQA